MNTRKISLTAQIQKVIGYRILFCSVAFMIIIFGLTIYDLSNSITQLRSRINEQIKPIEDFAIDQPFHLKNNIALNSVVNSCHQLWIVCPVTANSTVCKCE